MSLSVSEEMCNNKNMNNKQLSFSHSLIPSVVTDIYESSHWSLQVKWKLLKSEWTDLDLQLFVQSVVDPQVDVPFPVSLLLDGGNVGDGSLVNLSHRVGVRVVLHQAEVIKPRVVVVWVRLTETEQKHQWWGQEVTCKWVRNLLAFSLLYLL